MSRAERHELAVLLAALDVPSVLTSPLTPGLAATDEAVARASQHEPVRPDPFRIDPVLARERGLALLVSAGCCVVLAGDVLLAATLPHHFDAHHWRAVWVNFDAFLLAAFAVTAWAIWRERQVLILMLMLIGTMLCCDAWFDVGTSLATSGFGLSLLSAVLAELPLAFLAFAGARRLLRATVAAGSWRRHAQARQAAAPGAQAGLDALDWARVGNWGRTCAGQSSSPRTAGRRRSRRGPAAQPRRTPGRPGQAFGPVRAFQPVGSASLTLGPAQND